MFVCWLFLFFFHYSSLQVPPREEPQLQSFTVAVGAIVQMLKTSVLAKGAGGGPAVPRV